jgi:diacylglycerol kinase (ATP)
MNKQSGLTRIIKAFGYSLDGFRAAWQNEAAFRQEIVLCMILFPLGVWLGENGVEKALLTACLFVVLITELLNSAIEAAVDRVGEEWHVLAKYAKDLGSSAVFLALTCTVCVWALILL